MLGSNEEQEMVVLLREILETLKKIERNQPNPLDYG